MKSFHINSFQSTDLSDAFAHHQWYLATVKYQRLLPLPIARAQKSSHLSAYKFFIISMESFQTVSGCLKKKNEIISNSCFLIFTF